MKLLALYTCLLLSLCVSAQDTIRKSFFPSIAFTIAAPYSTNGGLITENDTTAYYLDNTYKNLPSVGLHSALYAGQAQVDFGLNYMPLQGKQSGFIQGGNALVYSSYLIHTLSLSVTLNYLHKITANSYFNWGLGVNLSRGINTSNKTTLANGQLLRQTNALDIGYKTGISPTGKLGFTTKAGNKSLLHFFAFYSYQLLADSEKPNDASITHNYLASHYSTIGFGISYELFFKQDYAALRAYK